MGIAITAEHQQLEEVARSFLETNKARASARLLLDASREELPPFWSALADLGWLGLHVPEEYGGSGFGLEELVIVAEALGRSVAPGPFLPTVIVSALLVDAGTEEQKARFLPALVDGSRAAAAGLGGTLHLAEDGSLDGDAGVVLGGGLADHLLLVAGDDVVILDRSDPDLTLSVPRNLDPTRRSARVAINGARMDENNVVRGAARRALAIARTLVAAEACGGARECLEMATGYAKVRQQFGRVIGTFQAVKHHCANMLVAAESAAAAVWDAARAGSDTTQFELAGAIAATQALPSFLRNAELNIQVHGGIGFTWEHDAHLLLRRAGTLLALFGNGTAEDVSQLVSGGVVRRPSLDLPPEAEEIRAEVRAFTSEIRSLPPSEQRQRFIDTGYVQPHWPPPWGRGAKAVEQLVIEEELLAAGFERPEYSISGWVTLTIIDHGRPEQAERWVRPTLAGDLVWCQLFSEPDAGSDAAGIRTRGTRVDGGWVVSGQKVWTSDAQQAHLGFATVRTNPDAAKHAGITTMVIDMHTLGVEVRPLREATGQAIFNEVFLNEVFVSDDDVVGPVDGGWKVARAALGNERVSIGERAPMVEIDLLDLYRRHGGSTPGAAGAVGRLLAQAHTLRVLNLRRAQRAVGGGEPGPEGNVTKLLAAEHEQSLADLGLELIGPDAALAEGPDAAVGEGLIFNRALTIGGGTSEITRNQIGERILGLPRDPLLR